MDLTLVTGYSQLWRKFFKTCTLKNSKKVKKQGIFVIRAGPCDPPLEATLKNGHKEMLVLIP